MKPVGKLMIEGARRVDAGMLLDLENASFTGDRLSARSLKRLISSPSAIMLVGRLDTELVGYALVLTRRGSRSARLYSLAVAASHSGKGIGRQLAMAAEDAAAGRGCDRMRLEVRGDNQGALSLYRRLGYTEEIRLPGYYSDGADGIRMIKRLDSAGSGARAITD